MEKLKLEDNDNSVTIIKTSRYDFEAIAVYREIIESSVLQDLYELVKYMDKKHSKLSGFLKRYNKFYYELMSNSGKSLSEYIIDKVLYTDNSFTRLSENKNMASSYIIEAATNDLKHLSRIASLKARDIKDTAIVLYAGVNYEKQLIKELGEWRVGAPQNPELSLYEILTDQFNEAHSWENGLRKLQAFHVNMGSGKFARYRGFLWEKVNGIGQLVGVAAPDPVKLTDLIGYCEERKLIVENTKCFLQGLPANNVLLYGDRGTGKSATIKALLNEYFTQGLRIIEISKDNLEDLPLILREIKFKTLKFVIFVDDLAFSDDENSYSALKAVLEGSLESRATNIVIYATSNRRHLIKEKFSDRSGLMSENRDEEIYAGDTIQEKLSLADRFGITVTFSSPDKEKYLNIVESLAKMRGLDIDGEYLALEAMKWELRYNGRSPRTAKQFIDYLEGKLKIQQDLI